MDNDELKPFIDVIENIKEEKQQEEIDLITFSCNKLMELYEFIKFWKKDDFPGNITLTAEEWEAQFENWKINQARKKL